jgi:phenylacetate-coenzyme A ligase PaaK-like adenylate-forming protein
MDHDPTARPGGAGAPPSWRAMSAAWEVAAARHEDTSTLAARREARWRGWLEAAASGSVLVREALGGRAPRDAVLGELPMLTKRTLMRRFGDSVVDPRLNLPGLRAWLADRTRIGEPLLGAYWAWESSGSGGTPAVFVQDADAMAVYDALEALRRPAVSPLRRWLDPFGLADRTAFVGATTGHFASTVNVERLRRLHPLVSARLRGFSFLLPAAELCAALQAWGPTVLATYPTAAELLAEEQAAGRLALRLHEVWTGGEALSPAVRRFVERAFGCPVVHSYGASEFLPLATECVHGAMHLNSDWAILEPVDARGRPVPPGEPCHTTLLTNLANRLQPLLRYDLGDRVTFAPGPCVCGSPLPVIDVVGRCDDAVVLRDARGRRVRLLPLALTTVIEEDAGVFAFQLEQLDGRHLRLRVAAGEAVGEAASRRAADALRAYLASQGLGSVRVSEQAGLPPRCGSSGKRPRVLAAARG